MKNILVLQNARIGDLLQTTPMLRGLKEKFPGCHISVLVNKLFAELKFDVQVLDEVIYFDQNGMYDLLQNESISLVQKYEFTKAFTDQFKKRDFDLVFNLPSDTNNHFLASLLAPRAKEIRGCMYTKDRALILKHPKMIFFYTTSEIRELNRFNIVDLQNLVADVKPAEKRLHFKLTPDGESFAERFLAENGVEAGDFVVALQPGASEERKKWNHTSFARLADELVKRFKARVILCGSRSEILLGEKIASLCSQKIINAVGKTSLSALGSVLRRCSLLVTNDTGTMHVAAAVGTRVIDLSTGPVHFRETGPYGEGNVVIQGDIECFPCHFDAVCNHLSCRNLITVEIVLKIIEALRSGLPLNQLSPQEFAGVKIYKARFNDIGRIEFLPVFKYRLTMTEVLSLVYAAMWEMFYGLRDKPLEAAQLLREMEETYDLGGRAELGRECRNVALQLSDLSALLTKAIAHMEEIISLAPDPRNADLIQQGCNHIEKIFNQILIQGKVHLAVRPLSTYLRLAIDSQEEGDISQVAREYLKAYRWVLDQANFMIAHLNELAGLLAKVIAA